MKKLERNLLSRVPQPNKVNQIVDALCRHQGLSPRECDRLRRRVLDKAGHLAKDHELIDDLSKRFADKLRDELSKNYFVFDWSQYNSNFFKALQMEKTMLFILMTLVVLVAVFNVVSTLFMVVTDKRSDIAILMTMGMTPSAVRKIFVLQGLIVGSLGILLGVAGGILLSLNLESIASGLESLLGFKFFKPEVYFISSVPSELHLTDVVLVAFISLILSFLATLYPSSKAAAVRPAQALRYE